jgi:hypothetical protein
LKIVKKYAGLGSVPDALEFVQQQTSGRHAYEIIREKTPAHAYFDVAWLDRVMAAEHRPAADAVDRVVMQTLAEGVRQLAEERFGVAEPQIYASMSTRMSTYGVDV